MIPQVDKFADIYLSIYKTTHKKHHDLEIKLLTSVRPPGEEKKNTGASIQLLANRTIVHGES
jgi:hypothetical protein